MKTSEKNIPKIIHKELKKVLWNDITAVLFGSRARGNFHSRSDWDIWVSNVPQLTKYKKSLVLEAMENLPYLIDIIYLDETEKSFQEIIKKDAIEI